MKTLLSILCAWGITGQALGAVEFAASLSEIRADHETCEEIFSIEEYAVQHHWVGPNYRTSVMHLDAAVDDEEEAFFHDSTWVGLYGPSGDLYYEKEYELADGSIVEFLGEGFLDRNVMYLELSVDVFADDALVCTGTATLAGFN